MDALRDIVEFHARRFAPLLPEECQVNPGVYGAELAFWVCTELAKRGVITGYPLSEDWGWYVEYHAASGAEFAVHCGNIAGSDDRWLLSLRRYGRGLFGRDLPPYEDAAPLVEAIAALLASDDAVAGMTWLYDAAGAT